MAEKDSIKEYSITENFNYKILYSLLCNTSGKKEYEKIHKYITNLRKSIEKQKIIKSYKELKELRDLLDEYKKEEIDKEKAKKLNKYANKLYIASYNIGINNIHENRLSNIDLLEFISLYRDNEEIFQNTKYIHFNSIDNKFFEVFNEENEQFKANFINFSIINNLNKKKFSNLDDYIQVMGSHLQLISFINDSENLSDFLIQKIHNIKTEFSEKIVIEILRKFKLNEIIIHRLINELEISKLSNDTVLDYLGQFHKKVHIQNKIFGCLTKRVVKNKSEIINAENTLSENVSLLLALIDKKYFDGAKYNNDYIEKTKKNMKEIYEQLSNFEFSMEELKLMDSINQSENHTFNLKSRCSILCLKREEQTNHLYNLLNNKIKDCLSTLENLNTIIKIFSKYFSNDNEDLIHYYRNLRDNIILKKSVSDFPTDIKEFDTSLGKACFMKKIVSIKLLAVIFDQTKLLNREWSNMEIMEAVKLSLNKLLGFLRRESEDQLKLNSKLMESVLKKLEEMELEDDIKKLSSMYKLPLDEITINENCIKLKMFKNRVLNIELFKKFLLLLNDFQANHGDNLLREEIRNEIELLEKSKSLNDLLDIYKRFKQLNLNLDILNSSSSTITYSVITKMYSEPNFVQLILMKTHDFKQLGKWIDEASDVRIKREDIPDFEECVLFLRKFKEKCADKSDKQIIESFNFFTHRKKYSHIGEYFEKSSKFYSDLNKLYKYYLNPSTLDREHLKSLLLKSVLTLKFKESGYECTADYNIKVKTREFDFMKGILNCHENFEELVRLREVAMVEDDDQNFDSFVEIVDDVSKIIQLLNDIFCKGYYKTFSYEIMIINGITYLHNPKTRQLKPIDLKEMAKELNIIRKDQEREILQAYKVNALTRLIYGSQFNLLNKIILGEFNRNKENEEEEEKEEEEENLSDDDERKFINMVKYITGNNARNYYLYDMKNNSKEITSLNQMFSDISMYLNQISMNNEFALETVYKDAELQNKSHRGIYSFACPLEAIEINAIYSALYLTGNFPLAQTVLYCSEDTSKEEVLSFIYRAMKCDYPVLFMLLKPENLRVEVKQYLIELLVTDKSGSQDRRQQQQQQDMLSCLLLIYSKENENENENEASHDIIHEIQKLINHHDFHLPEACISTKTFPDVVFYSSDSPGLGKSTKIKSDFENENNSGYEYIYFPLGGDVNKHDIMKRLLKLTGKKVELHIDILEMEDGNIELMKEFLFSFVLLKYYSHQNNIFYYGDEIKIKIEIPKGHSDGERAFPFFRFFKNDTISMENLPKLHISNEEEYSDIQIVCKYIKNLDKIDYVDICPPELNDPTRKSRPDQFLTVEECFNIILDTIGSSNFNFYKLQIFIRILSDQLRHLSKSIYFNTLTLAEAREVRKNLDKVRSTIIKSLINYVCWFINSIGKTIEDEQKLTMLSHEKRNIKYEEAIQQAKKYSAEKRAFSIANRNLGMIFFNEDEYSISILPTYDKNSREYQVLKAIYNSNTLDKDMKELVNFKNFTAQDFLKEVRNVLNLNIPINEQELSGRSNGMERNKKVGRGGERKYLEDIVKSYVFTEDNFIKLLLISLRLRANVPVIMMGECGCGKSSLIRRIAKLKGVKMYMKNIHSGTDDKDIEQFLRRKKLFVSSSDSEHEGGRQEIWIFFDEINTCRSLGLIAEIMLKHTCKGERIKENIKFIGACNPYRLNTQKDALIGLHNKERYSPRELAYKVYPLPNCLVNYIFNFGTPEDTDIKKYIENMVSRTFEDLNVTKHENISSSIWRRSVNTIFAAHIFIRDTFDISAISLREMKKWKILFKWFIDFLRMPYIIRKLNTSYNMDNQEIYSLALNLSIYICYYIRIFPKSKRNEFLALMRKEENFGSQFDFEKFAKILQHMIADEVHLKKGIAKNKLLLENLFSVFVCINLKIPLVIVGGPGCSKSLSTQCIIESMNGKDSSSEFFRLFPKLYTVSFYQGSLTTTSSEVKKLFKFKGPNSSISNENPSEKTIKIIVFNEIGLAEISSEHNPLKAIHFELDGCYDGDDDDDDGDDDGDDDDDREHIGFIGISNRALDASKMNHLIHLSIPEPDMEDLFETSLAVAQSYDERLLNFYSRCYKELSVAYYHYIKKLEENSGMCRNEFNNEFTDYSMKQFHGTRDFYGLITNFSELIMDHGFPKSNDKIKEIMNESIARNFGGLRHSVSLFYDHLQLSNENMGTPTVMECIEKNINDFNSRFLLLLTPNHSISHFLISSLLTQFNKNYECFYGSKFTEDHTFNHYFAKILRKVKSSMANENIIVFNHLTNLYPSLSDLFNQNYSTINKYKYAKIALGSSNVQNYFINDKVRFIVILDYNEVKKQDPRFLNQFEKQILSVENLLNETEIEVSKTIYELLKQIVKNHDENNTLKLDLSYELINCSLEEIQAIIYKLSNKFVNNSIEDSDFENTYINENGGSVVDPEILSYEDVLSQQVLETIVPTFSQDLILYMRDSSFPKKYEKEYLNILKIYRRDCHLHQNIKNYLEHMKTNRHIIYTFSNLYDSIFGKGDEMKQFTNEHFGCSFTQKTVKNIYVKNYKSEREMEEEISDYLSNTNLNLGIFHFGIDDIDNLIHINYLVENNENLLKSKGKFQFQSKIIIFMIHLKRKIVSRDPEKEEEEEKAFDKLHQGRLMSHLSDWKQFFIDNLNRYDNSLRKLLFSSNINLYYDHKNLFDDKDEKFNEILQQSLNLITYNFKINLSSNYFIFNLYSNSLDTYKSMIYDYISNDRELKNTISSLVIEKMRNQSEISLVTNILRDYEFKDSDVDFISVINNYGITIFRKVFVQVMAQLEKYNLFSSKLLSDSGRELDSKIFNKIIQYAIQKSNMADILVSSPPQPEHIDLIMGMTNPCISLLFDEITKNESKFYYFLSEKGFREGKISLEKFTEIRAISVANFKDDFLSKYEEIYLTPLLQNNEIGDESGLISYTNQKASLKDLLKDYIRFFLSRSNENFEDPSILKFFIILYKLFISRADASIGDNSIFSIDNIAEFILFIESYEHLMYNICKFIKYMNKSGNSFLNYLISLLPMNLFKTENNELSIINDIFVNLYESIIYCIINIEPSFEDNEEKFLGYIEGIIVFIRVLKKMSLQLNLSMPLLDFLMRHIFVLNTLIANKIPSLQLKMFLQLLKKESSLYIVPLYESIAKKNNFSLERDLTIFFKLLKRKNQKYSEEEPEIIHEEYEFLINALSSKPYCTEFIVDMLMNKLEIYKSDDIRKIVLSIICSNEVLIQKEQTQIIFESIFNGEIISNINENSIIKYLNKVDNAFLNNILCNLFQKKIKQFFELNIKEDNVLLINNEYSNILNQSRLESMKNNKFALKYCKMFENLYNSYMKKGNNDENNNTTKIINKLISNVTKTNIYNIINKNALINSNKNQNLNRLKSERYKDYSSNHSENSKTEDITSYHSKNDESKKSTISIYIEKKGYNAIISSLLENQRQLKNTSYVDSVKSECNDYLTSNSLDDINDDVEYYSINSSEDSDHDSDHYSNSLEDNDQDNDYSSNSSERTLTVQRNTNKYFLESQLNYQ